jgi:hypothetical protein
MTLQTKNPTSQDLLAYTTVAQLSDGKQTTIHVVRYAKDKYHPRIVSFQDETILLPWCKERGFSEAFGGGYFLRGQNKPLGELWLGGVKQPSVAFAGGRNKIRGSVYIDNRGLKIAPRNKLPKRPVGDLLQAGPTLVHRGVSLFLAEEDPEGFSATAVQHDEDINAKRHPRAGIGIDDKFIWTVTVDGRSKNDSGLFLHEFAELFQILGAPEAVNLDGGRSSTQICNGRLINRPRRNHEQSAIGYPIYNAIIFDKL